MVHTAVAGVSLPPPAAGVSSTSFFFFLLEAKNTWTHTAEKIEYAKSAFAYARENTADGAGGPCFVHMYGALCLAHSHGSWVVMYFSNIKRASALVMEHGSYVEPSDVSKP